MDFQNMSDSQLAMWVRCGEPDAFVELTARYKKLVRAKAKAFTGPGAPEAEDLLQEGFLGLFTAAMTYKDSGGAGFATYAGVCVYNSICSAMRRYGNAGNRSLNESVPLEDLEERSRREISLEDEYELREGFREIWRKMWADLTPLERQAMQLYMSGCRREDIEQRFGMPLKTFDNALHRARMKLKKRSAENKGRA